MSDEADVLRSINNTLAAGLGPNLSTYTVATLPTDPETGDVAAVSDADSPTFLGALTGGGSTFTPVVFNGTDWVSY